MNERITKYPICRHVRANGRRCQSPALEGATLCCYHRNLRRSLRATIRPGSAPLRPETIQYFLENGSDAGVLSSAPAPLHLAFPPLEDAESVQLAISTLFQAIASGQLDANLARPLLRTLQLACINLRSLAAASRTQQDPSTLAHRIVRTSQGLTVAAPGEGNGVPTEQASANSLLSQFFDEICVPREDPDKQVGPALEGAASNIDAPTG